MSKKMKRELAETDRIIAIVNERHRLSPADPYGKASKIALYFTQKRADIANRIGRKQNGS